MSFLDFLKQNHMKKCSSTFYIKGQHFTIRFIDWIGRIYSNGFKNLAPLSYNFWSSSRKLQAQIFESQNILSLENKYVQVENTLSLPVLILRERWEFSLRIVLKRFATEEVEFPSQAKWCFPEFWKKNNQKKKKKTKQNKTNNKKQ